MAPKLLVERAGDGAARQLLGDLRSSNGVSAKKMMPAFDALAKPLIDSPGNCTAPATPGCLRPISAILPHHRLGAVQRRRVRQLREGDQVLLVLRGHEAASARREKPNAGHATSSAVHGQRERRCRRDHAPDDAAVAVRCRAANTRLNRRNSQPNRRSMHARQPVLGGVRAAAAGSRPAPATASAS